MTRRAARVVLVAVLALAARSAAAEEGTESAFERARRLAFSGERRQARELCLEILEERPDHWDARVLLGRLYAWDKEYGLAREELTRVLQAKPDYADARNALIDVELWSHHPEARSRT
jgi:tetratricopeptide (TPR) repeat protein